MDTVWDPTVDPASRRIPASETTAVVSISAPSPREGKVASASPDINSDETASTVPVSQGVRTDGTDGWHGQMARTDGADRGIRYIARTDLTSD